MNGREIVELVRACSMRVCTTEEHFGCPFGDRGLDDCAERLADAYWEAAERALLMLEIEEDTMENKEYRWRVENEEHGIVEVDAETMMGAVDRAATVWGVTRSLVLRGCCTIERLREAHTHGD